MLSSYQCHPARIVACAEVWQEPRLLVWDMVAITTHTMSQQCLLTQALPTARPSRRVVAAPRKAVELKDPPYALDALEPKMSKDTLEFHWGKHHRGYVTTLNGQIKDKPLDSKSLEEIVLATWNDGSPTPEFNPAAQIWNHDFFWEGMSPNGGSPSGEIASKIDEAFGSLDEFKKQFSTAGATQFGSGWAWLVKKSDGSLGIEKTPNAQTPFHLQGMTPLLTMDVWEHAYYLDFQNRRPDYIKTFVNELINWDKVTERYNA